MSAPLQLHRRRHVAPVATLRLHRNANKVATQYGGRETGCCVASHGRGCVAALQHRRSPTSAVPHRRLHKNKRPPSCLHVASQQSAKRRPRVGLQCHGGARSPLVCSSGVGRRCHGSSSVEWGRTEVGKEMCGEEMTRRDKVAATGGEAVDGPGTRVDCSTWFTPVIDQSDDSNTFP